MGIDVHCIPKGLANLGIINLGPLASSPLNSGGYRLGTAIRLARFGTCP